MLGINNKGFQEAEDEYRYYIDNLEIVPDFLYSNYEGCKMDELKQKHDDLINKIQHNNFSFEDINNLILVNTSLANCLHNTPDEEYKRILLETADYLRTLNRTPSAGRIYYFLGDNKKARECFEASPQTLEELIKLTPAEELPALRDKFVADKRYLEAGKVAWYEGDKEEARQIIEQSDEFKQAYTECKELVKNKLYLPAVRMLWRRLKLPFAKETVMGLCKSNRKCLSDVNNYNQNKDVISIY